MKIKLIILFSFFFLTACGPSKLQIQVANYVCSNKGGVYKITGFAKNNVICNNNTYHTTKGVVIPLEFLKKKT